MTEITYQFISPEKERKRDRIQLFLSMFILFIMILDVIEKPTPQMLGIGTVAVILGCMFLFCAIRYDHLRQAMKDKFEMLLFLITGIVFLFNSIILRLQGSSAVWKIHLAIGILYVLVLPGLAYYGKKMLFLKLDESGFHVKKFPRGYRSIPWKAVSSVSIESGFLVINRFQKKYPKKFWLDNDRQSFLDLVEENAKKQNVEVIHPHMSNPNT